jgi:hypothetical protein
VSNEQRGLSPQDQEKLGAHMAEVFANARAADEFDAVRKCRGGRTEMISVPVCRAYRCRADENGREPTSASER